MLIKVIETIQLMFGMLTAISKLNKHSIFHAVLHIRNYRLHLTIVKNFCKSGQNLEALLYSPNIFFCLCGVINFSGEIACKIIAVVTHTPVLVKQNIHSGNGRPLKMYKELINIKVLYYFVNLL